jgi:DNA-binding NtrC family response regulator
MDLEILIVDDKIEDAEAVAGILSELANVKTTVMTSPDKALQAIDRKPERFAVILLDFNLNIKNLDGLVFAKKIWQVNPQQLIAIFSGESSLDVPIKCIGTPIVEFIQKSAPATLIQRKVQNLLQKYSATHRPFIVSTTQDDSTTLCAEAGIVSKSPVMAYLTGSVKRIAVSEATTVLIRGASGTGKELIARAIHNLSRRKEKPFIAINMGAFQSTLIESELFGHEKGAFTGANSSRQGSFELANGGTIFLDEIGELPLDLQVKLLRVLQEREVQPVGASKPIKIDVRVIAATHVNIESQITNGKFRFDLFQRLNGITLKIPNLIERVGDIQLLALHFLKKLKSKKSINQATLKLLESYSWPGNVRQLENVIQNMDVLTDDLELLPKHLPSEIFDSAIEKESSFDFSMKYKDMVKHIERLEKDYYLNHLLKAKSVRDAAINRMDMPLTTLRNKMNFYNIGFKTGEIDNQPNEIKGEENEQTI